MEIEVQVKAIVTDQEKNYMVLLENLDESKILPIWIGPFEAQAIALPLKNEFPVRPFTHDLLKNMCEKFKGEVRKVIIKDINPEGTYFAEVHLEFENDLRILDSRPSDALALALRSNSPIYMSIKLIEFTINPENLHMRNSDDDDKNYL